MIAGIACRYLELRPRSMFRTWLVSRTGCPTSRRVSASCLRRPVYWVHVALHQIAVLRLKVHDTVKFVVAELLADGLPDAVRRGLGCAHDVAHVLGDGDVELADDALVDDDPVRVVALRSGWRRGDVRDEIEFTEEGIEEAAPLVVVGVGEFEDDRNMGLDVDSLKNGDRRGSRDAADAAGVGDVVGGSVRGGGTIVGDVALEQWVEIHGGTEGGRGATLRDCGDHGKRRDHGWWLDQEKAWSADTM